MDIDFTVPRDNWHYWHHFHTSVTDVVGFTSESAILCVDCATKRYGIITRETFDREGNPVTVVFRGQQTDSPDVCDCCFAEIETTVIGARG